MRPAQYIIDVAVSCANQERANGNNKFRVGAAIYNKSKLVSFGTNISGRSVRSYNKNFVKHKGEIHAEVLAIINARRDLAGCGIVVVRLNKRGDLRIAKPCEMCYNYCVAVGIRRTNIYYSNTEGRVVKL